LPILTARRAIVNQTFVRNGIPIESLQTTFFSGGTSSQDKEKEFYATNLIFSKQKMKNQDSILRPSVFKLKTERLRYPSLANKKNENQEWWSRAKKET
jgi:hypothetical protein